MTLVRVRLSRGSPLRQVTHPQPTTGTPTLVPVPRNNSRSATFANAFGVLVIDAILSARGGGFLEAIPAAPTATYYDAYSLRVLYQT